MTRSGESSSRDTSNVTAEMESMNRWLLQFSSDDKFSATYISGRKAVHGPFFALLEVVFAEISGKSIRLFAQCLSIAGQFSGLGTGFCYNRNRHGGSSCPFRRAR
jgi:hypothetical protein